MTEITIDKVAGKANIILDSSKIDLFQTCEQRYNIRHNLNKDLPFHLRSRALTKGTLAHEGCAVYYKLLAEGLYFNDRMHACLMKMREFSSDPNQSNLDEDDSKIVINAVEESLDHWRPEDETFSILAVEQPFAYVLYEDDFVRIIISGKIDLLVDKPELARSAGYMNLPIDHKTQSKNFDAPRLSNQFINYAIACNSNYLFVNKIGLQKTVEPTEKFKRVPFSYDETFKQQWKDNLTKVILGRYLTCVGLNEWNLNPTSCLKFNRLCEYYDICDSSGPEAKAWKMEANYVQVEEWDVTKPMTHEGAEG